MESSKIQRHLLKKMRFFLKLLLKMGYISYCCQARYLKFRAGAHLGNIAALAFCR